MCLSRSGDPPGTLNLKQIDLLIIENDNRLINIK